MKNLMENRGFEIARFKQSVHIGIAAEVQWLLCDYSTVNELAGKRPLWAAFTDLGVYCLERDAVRLLLFGIGEYAFDMHSEQSEVNQYSEIFEYFTNDACRF